MNVVIFKIFQCNKLSVGYKYINFLRQVTEKNDKVLELEKKVKEIEEKLKKSEKSLTTTKNKATKLEKEVCGLILHIFKLII